MKLNSVHLIDLEKVPDGVVPGNFIIQLFPTPEPGEAPIFDTGMTGWTTERFGTPDLQGFVPGCHKTYVMTDANPPFIAFQIRDYSHKTTQKRVKHGVLTEQQLATLGAEEKSQMSLKSALKAPSVASAMTAQILAQLVDTHDISKEFAQHALKDQFGFGETTAQGLLQRAGEKLQNERGASRS